MGESGGAAGPVWAVGGSSLETLKSQRQGRELLAGLKGGEGPWGLVGITACPVDRKGVGPVGEKNRPGFWGEEAGPSPRVQDTGTGVCKGLHLSWMRPALRPRDWDPGGQW